MGTYATTTDVPRETSRPGSSVRANRRCSPALSGSRRSRDYDPSRVADGHATLRVRVLAGLRMRFGRPFVPRETSRPGPPMRTSGPRVPPLPVLADSTNFRKRSVIPPSVLPGCRVRGGFVEESRRRWTDRPMGTPRATELAEESFGGLVGSFRRGREPWRTVWGDSSREGSVGSSRPGPTWRSGPRVGIAAATSCPPFRRPAHRGSNSNPAASPSFDEGSTDTSLSDNGSPFRWHRGTRTPRSALSGATSESKAYAGIAEGPRDPAVGRPSLSDDHRTPNHAENERESGGSPLVRRRSLEAHPPGTRRPVAPPRDASLGRRGWHIREHRARCNDGLAAR